MAKIVGDVPPFIATRDNLTIYLLNGEYIVRTKSSLTGKRVKRDPVFAKTMKFARWLKQASRIASRIYQQMPADERIYKQYRQLIGKAMSLLKEGFDAVVVIIMLEAVYLAQSVDNTDSRHTGECCEAGCKFTHENSSKCKGCAERTKAIECKSKYRSTSISEYSYRCIGNSNSAASYECAEYNRKYSRESISIYSYRCIGNSNSAASYECGKYNRKYRRTSISECSYRCIGNSNSAASYECAKYNRKYSRANISEYSYRRTVIATKSLTMNVLNVAANVQGGICLCV